MLRLILIILILSGCGKDRFNEAMVLGGLEVSSATLNQGYRLYQRYCVSCHGINGDGQGEGGQDLNPAPRNFIHGFYKFKSTAGDSLPIDEDLARTIRRGLSGTYMNAFTGLSDEDMDALIQYLKTFSPRWLNEQPGEVLPLPGDPWGEERQQAAIDRGEEVYHLNGQCVSCHPSYLSEEDVLSLQENSREIRNSEIQLAPVQSGGNSGRIFDSEYGRLLSPDLLDDIPAAGCSKLSVFQTLYVGIGGTPMLGLADEILDEDIWAMAYYIRNLCRIRGTGQEDEIRARLE